MGQPLILISLSPLPGLGVSELVMVKKLHELLSHYGDSESWHRIVVVVTRATASFVAVSNSAFW